MLNFLRMMKIILFYIDFIIKKDSLNDMNPVSWTK